MRIIQVLSVLTLMLGSPYAYKDGPPPSSCLDMFPVGHNTSARSDVPPFFIQVSQTSYRAGDVITLNLTSSGDWFFEGVFIQARLADCSSNISVGTFQVPPTDDFLREMNCNSNASSAVAHYSHLHVYNKTFTWTAPDQAIGHVYFRGTFVRKVSKFWTNVFSEMIRDETSNIDVPGSYCPVRRIGATALAPTARAPVILLIILVLISFV